MKVMAKTTLSRKIIGMAVPSYNRPALTFLLNHLRTRTTSSHINLDYISKNHSSLFSISIRYFIRTLEAKTLLMHCVYTITRLETMYDIRRWT